MRPTLPLSHLCRFAIPLVALAILAGEAVAAEARITLVLLCDIYDMQENHDRRGGMARIAAAVKAERARNPNTIVAHAGDAISPSLLSGIDKGAHMIELLNLAAPDIFVPGNHEFDFGPEVFRQRMAEARFPIYAANLLGPDGAALPGIRVAGILEFGPVRLGLIGLTHEDSVRRSSPGNLRFTASLPALQDKASELRRQGADIVVAVAHADRRLDQAMIDSGAAEVILSGHDHDLLVNYTGRVAFLEAMQEGFYVGIIDLTVDVSEADGKRRVKWWPRFRLIDTADVTPDPDVAARVAAYQGEISKELDTVIGRTEVELDSRSGAVRGGETAIGNLFADAIRAATGAEIALLNGGGIRGNKVYAAGSPVRRRDVLAELPFGNKTYVLEITGADLRAALEQGLAVAERTTGAFPQVSGLLVRGDVTRPAGDRIVRLEANGRSVEPAARYRLATVDFLARGGDGYAALKAAKVIEGATDAKLMANHVMSYLAEKSAVAPAIEGRIILARPKAPN